MLGVDEPPLPVETGLRPVSLFCHQHKDGSQTRLYEICINGVLPHPNYDRLGVDGAVLLEYAQFLEA